MKIPLDEHGLSNTREVWQEAKAKLKPHNDNAPSKGGCQKVGIPPWSNAIIHELKPNKAPDVGGWTTEVPKLRSHLHQNPTHVAAQLVT